MSYVRPLVHGQLYHIYNRGVNRENLFKEERNYPYFLHLLKKHVLPIADIYAYCLLRNHFHLLVRIRMQSEIRRSAPKSLWRSTPGRQFGNCFNAYAKAINNAYERTGCLFERPFKRRQVLTSEYFRQLVVYIHRNPEKHGLVPAFSDWPYSSFDRFIDGSDPVLQVATVLTSFGGLRDFHAAHDDLEFITPVNSDVPRFKLPVAVA